MMHLAKPFEKSETGEKQIQFLQNHQLLIQVRWDADWLTR